MPNNKLKSWNIRDLAISLNAVPLDDGGYAEDEVMVAEWDEEQFTVYKGADGEITRAATNNGLMLITLKYAQTAAANDRLSALHIADLAAPNGAGAGMFMSRDTYGRSVIKGERAWVTGFPNTTWGKSVQVMEWKIQIADARMSFYGGR